MTDARGVTTTRAYDALNRVTTATSTIWPKSEVVSWSYDDPTLGRDGRVPGYALYVEQLQRDLGKRGQPRKKRRSEAPPELVRPDPPESGTT
jgi:hypothetical protein